MRIEKYLFEARESALDSVDSADISVRKLQSSIILILKFGKLGWIEYTDKDAFTVLTYLGFHLDHKVNKYIQMFPKFIVF